MDLQVFNTAFREGEMIPIQYACDGSNVSPPLRWGSIPKDAQSLALICEDPDAPTGLFVHWILFNLPPLVSSLPEGVPGTETLEQGGTQGRNDFGRIGYDGPCPPSGDRAHRYFFRLYALDTQLGLQPGATKDEFMPAINGHILAAGQMMGIYKRRMGRPAKA